MTKPVAESCLRNQEAIFQVLLPYLSGDACSTLLELGSGTGQHSVYLSNRLPNLTWQPSDIPGFLGGIEAWREESQHNNVLPPIPIDVDIPTNTKSDYDAVFTANTIHYVRESTGEHFISLAGNSLKAGGWFFIYGPFKLNGMFSGDGDIRLDEWLRARDPESGIRDKDWVIERARSAGLIHIRDHSMPANNLILVFQKSKGEP